VLLFNRDLIIQVIRKPAFLYSGVRKIVQDLNWEVDYLPHLTYQDLGYGKNKEKQMERNYIDSEELNRVKSILTKRKDHQFTSVAMSMRGGKKDSRSMGWCMLSLIVTSGPKLPTIVEVQYRSTELILKFGADLVFLPTVFDRLGIVPNLIRFRFANAYLSGVFFPTLCSFWDPIDFLEFLWKHDRKLFAGGTRFFLRSAYKENQRFPYSPENQQHKFLWSRLGKQRVKLIRDYLHEKHKLIGKPLPNIHHPLEEDDDV
jgi:hypothetical protein